MTARYTEIVLTDAQGQPRTYQLLFTLNALVTIEKLLGKSIPALFHHAPQEDGDAQPFLHTLFTAQNLQAFLYAGLYERHPEVTQEELGRQITFDQYPHVMETVAGAFLASLGLDGAGTPEEGAHEDVPGKTLASSGPGSICKTPVPESA